MKSRGQLTDSVRASRPTPRRRLFLRGGSALVFSLLATLAGASAFAQGSASNLKPAHPDVLLLLDTSGSMERNANGTLPVCTPGVASAPNRWGQLVQVLTGDVQPFYSCQTVDRASDNFKSEYQLKTNGIAYPPYDANYSLPYHRPLSKTTNNNCAVAPGGLPGMTAGNGGSGPNGDRALGGAAWDFPAGSIVHRLLGQDPVNNPSSLATNPDPSLFCFDQLKNGLLDTSGAQVRFALMTFDSDPDKQTGVELGAIATGSPKALQTGNPFSGGFSYYPNWTQNSTSVAAGRPLGCEVDQPLEVGARNFAAPPWEGRAIGFSNPLVPNPSAADSQNINEQIQQAILAIRPYGATPIAGLLKDAENYWYNDDTGPNGSPPGGDVDPYFKGNCRKAYNILLTDGVENLNMRPDCVGGTCPFPISDATAAEMLNGGSTGKLTPVATFVVGFNVSATGDGAGQSCSLVDQSTCGAPSTPAQVACCPFHNLAKAGGTDHAYFAENANDLAAQLKVIIGSIAQDATPLTIPAFSQSPSSSASGGSSTSKFLASFDPSLGAHWPGRIQRKRNVCQGVPQIPTEKDVDPTKGDDFAANLNSANPANRVYFAVRSTTATDASETGTLRQITTNPTPDGLPVNTFDQIGSTGADIWNAGTGIDAARMNIDNQTCKGRNPTVDFLTKNQCAERAIRFALAQPSVDYGTQFDRVPDPTTDAFRNIFRATPAVYTPATALLRDPTYETFSNITLAKYKQLAVDLMDDPSKAPARPSVVAAAINDGTFSLWFADIDKQKNNQLWAMLLPKALPSLNSAVSTFSKLADGRPVVQDVVFSRSVNDVLANTNKWHTVALAGYGENGPGYYAIELTDPRAPKFLWQITAPELLGPVSGTPAIATVVTRGPNAGDPIVERGAAVLVGGYNKLGGNGSCPRRLSPGGSDISWGPTNALPEGYPARGTVKAETADCALTTKLPGRSVSIVDIETGEIIRVFMPLSDKPSWLPAVKVIDTPFDNTFVGSPTVFPSGTGAVATRFYAGDRMGSLWRFDVSSSIPDEWKGELAVDMYNTPAYAAASALRTNTDPAMPAVNDAAQPIELQPVITSDDLGNTVILAASGSQDDFFVRGRISFLYSLSEVFDISRQRRMSLNWLEPMYNEVTSGPLTIFDGTAYFARYRAPVGSQQCDSGLARICGMSFIKPNPNIGNLPIKGGKDTGVLDPTGAGPCLDEGSGVVPGVTINQTTNCAETSTDASSGHIAVTSMTTGTFSVYAQTSGKDPLNRQAGRVVNQVIRQPRYNALVDSWAIVTD